MDAERIAIIDALSKPTMKNFALGLNIKYQIKSAEESIKARKKGNDIFIKRKHIDEDHKMILYLYNKSIAYAPSEFEELMFAYSNRAYLLMHFNKYNEAIDSLDKALQLTDSTKMILKLHCQKAKCFAALGSSMKDDVLKEIDQIFKNSKLSIEDTNQISNFIEKAKSTVATMKQFKPNHKFLQEKEECNKIIIDREKVDPFDFVEIKQTKNMGRGLYAKTDFKTGDLVLVEKPCLIGPHFANQFIFCSYCLTVAWTGIPCETCHDFIFCSLKCKNKAWKEHHHMECSLTPHLLLCDPEIPDYIFMSLKFIISLIKDTKAIDELKPKLKISKNNQVEIVNDKLEQKIDLFNKLMSLSHKLALDCSNRLTIHTVKILICMVKYSTFFSDKIKDMQYNDLSTNEDFMFIGSLLLRLVKINRVNNHDISDIAELSSSQCLDIKAGRINRSRGCCVGLISSMTNHSCVPNIRRCFSEDMKYIFYALEPIASGTQLFDAYGDFFYVSPLMHRREKRKNFVCQCIACEEDWPPVLLSPWIDEAIYFTELSFTIKISPLIDTIFCRKYLIDKQLLQTVVDQINEIVDVLPQPSTTRCLLLQALEAIYEKYYGLAVPFENFCSF